MAPHITKAIEDADVILAVNARFGEATTQAWTLLDVPYPKQRIIQTHASDAEIGKIYQPELAIHAGPNRFSAALLEMTLDGSNLAQRADWLAGLKTAYQASLRPPAQNSPVDMAAVMAWLQDNLPDDVIITNGAGNFALWPNKVFCYGQGQSLLAPQSGQWVMDFQRQLRPALPVLTGRLCALLVTVISRWDLLNWEPLCKAARGL